MGLLCNFPSNTAHKGFIKYKNGKRFFCDEDKRFLLLKIEFSATKTQRKTYTLTHWQLVDYFSMPSRFMD
jgi:hypothetical protein